MVGLVFFRPPASGRVPLDFAWSSSSPFRLVEFLSVLLGVAGVERFSVGALTPPFISF